MPLFELWKTIAIEVKTRVPIMADSVDEAMREEEVAKLNDDIVDVSEIISLRIVDVILIFILWLQELWQIPGTLDAVDIKNDMLIYSADCFDTGVIF